MNTRIQGILRNQTPWTAVETNGYFQVGDKVRINDENSLSHMTVGTLTGIIHRGENTPLALVQWLDNAPPVRTLITKIQRMKPTRFWMVVSVLPDDVQYARVDTQDAVRDGTISPAKKFYDREEAADVARRLTERYRRDYILLESTEYYSNDTRTVERI